MTDPANTDVLLVEDELFIALDLQMTIEDAGFAGLGALTGPSGLDFSDGWVSGGPALGLGLVFR